MRKLATVQRIIKLEPIIGADKIEKATILGWELVVKKGEFNINDLCIYIEIDSILPQTSEFEFMRERKFRVKTIKLKGQISQGICFPLSIVYPYRDLKEGDDLTDTIGVKKYDPQVIAENKLIEEQSKIYKNRLDKFFKRYNWYRKLLIKPSKLPFPSFISKTDEERIQNLPNICQSEKNTIFEVTEKLDGQSATFFLLKNPKKWQFWKKYIFGVCSRNLHLIKKDNSSYWSIAQQLDIENKLKTLHRSYLNVNLIVIQGEIIGPKIQNNKYNIDRCDFYAFNLKLNVGSKKFNYTNAEMKTILFPLNIKTVPLIDDQFILKDTISEIVQYSKGISILNCNVLREGVVVRSKMGKLSFKVINPDFLLKHE